MKKIVKTSGYTMKCNMRNQKIWFDRMIGIDIHVFETV